MRILLLLFLALAPASGVLAQVSVAVPSQDQNPAYPLKVRILDRGINQSDDAVSAWGRADLYDGRDVQGFDYQVDCNMVLMLSRGEERFSARWKKQDRELELLVNKIGSGKSVKCAVKTNLQPFVYEFGKGGIVTESEPEPAEPTLPLPPFRKKGASSSSPIKVDGWARPEPGWLYVLDPAPESDVAGGQIRVLDPETGKVMGTISTGSDPDFALSPDGSRLYVASAAEDNRSNLALIDTSNGTVVQTATIEDRVVAANGIPPFSGMSVSGDGLVLRILLNPPNSPETDGFQLATFATWTGGFLPGRIHLGNCGYGRFIDMPAADHFDFFCPTTNRIRRIRVEKSSGDIDNSFVVLPWERRLGVAQIFLFPGDQFMTIARGDGAVFTMDTQSATFSATPMQGDIQGRILPAAWPVSPDGSRLYLGYSSSPNRRFYLDYDRSATQNPRTQTVNEIRVLDTSTWRTVGHIKTRARFWTAVLTNDGSLLYAMSPESHSVQVIDTATMRETHSIPIGGTPTLALVAP